MRDDLYRGLTREVIMVNRRSRLVLLCGLPSAGKTTVAKKLERELSAVRLCPDEWLMCLGLDVFDSEARERVERCLWQHAQALLASGAVVILENGFWERAERDEKRLMARSMGTAVELRYLRVPLEELERRIALRNHAPGAVVMTAELLRNCQGQFEAPTQAELDLFDAPLL
ncbi:AAA family ATPase [Streptomyces sp. NPDC093105]|uniref:AAA family ATPase n=1 Tax=Streptomyces sp. NPDC093105 TaxID=3366029 RepID=UPI0037FB2E01